jgi:hypothetical protein
MSWAHNVSTESWPYDYSSASPAVPGTVGPYGTISVGSDYTAIPADSVLTINIMHGGGGEDSHTNCILRGVGPFYGGTIMESNGDYGTCTNGNGGRDAADSLWTDHWYLPGPVVDDVVPAPPVPLLYYPDVSNNQWASDADLISFLSQLKGQGFAGVVHKASEGNYFADRYWPICQDWCVHNDLSWLPYHYVTTDDPASQAQTFVNNSGGPNVMLDVEANSGDINNFWAVVNAFNNAGVNVSLAYIPRWYWEQIGSPDLSALPANGIQLVSSNYPAGGGEASEIYAAAGGDNGPGWAPYGGATPAAWQFTDKANIAGKTVDCNAYHGTSLDVFFTS